MRFNKSSVFGRANSRRRKSIEGLIGGLVVGLVVVVGLVGLVVDPNHQHSDQAVGLQSDKAPCLRQGAF